MWFKQDLADKLIKVDRLVKSYAHFYSVANHKRLRYKEIPVIIDLLQKYPDDIQKDVLVILTLIQNIEEASDITESYCTIENRLFFNKTINKIKATQGAK